MLLLQIYNHWLTNIKDWCISRQLWWGHRIPVWYIVGKKCEEDYIVARTEGEALAKAQEKYGKSVEIYQESDVLDTWFSRSVFLCKLYGSSCIMGWLISWFHLQNHTRASYQKKIILVFWTKNMKFTLCPPLRTSFFSDAMRSTGWP